MTATYDTGGAPLAACPECGCDLTGSYGAVVESAAGHHRDAYAALAGGRVSVPVGPGDRVLCGGCARDLSDMESVSEVRTLVSA